MKHFFILLAFMLWAGVSVVCAREKVKFLLFTDLHYDIMPDGDERLRAIGEAARKNKVDFVIELGDFVPPFPKYNAVKELLHALPMPVYHTLGNHDIDRTDKQAYVDFWEMPAPYYYFDRGKFRFIVLDSNFFEDKDGTIRPYDKGNYYAYSEEQRNRFGQTQLKWLEELLQDTAHIHLVFCHGPINDGYASIVANNDIHGILTGARSKGAAIAAVFGGHIHSDNYHAIDGIHYLQVNSASYIWGGDEFVNTERYPDSVYRQRPALKYTIPYEKAVYAIVEADDKGNITIRGTKGRYVQPETDPELLKTKPYPCSPTIENRKLKY